MTVSIRIYILYLECATNAFSMRSLRFNDHYCTHRDDDFECFPTSMAKHNFSFFFHPSITIFILNSFITCITIPSYYLRDNQLIMIYIFIYTVYIGLNIIYFKLLIRAHPKQIYKSLLP